MNNVCKTVFDVGYIGNGNYKSRINGNRTKEYSVWYAMMQRCYSENLDKSKNSYKSVFVCDDWHNFQNFAEWYKNNYYEIDKEKIALDKDILIKGNKVYSPSTCVFAPTRINNLILSTKAKRGDLPLGVYLEGGRYRVQCKNENKKRKNLGRYDSVDEAFLTYKKYKEDLIVKIADVYKSKIPKKLYEGLLRYKIEKFD